MSKFSLKRKSEPVVLMSEDGQEMNCELREMSASKRDTYLQGLSGRVSLDANGKPTGVSNFNGLQAELISSCLFRENKLVPAEEIQEWPSSTVSDIYKLAQRINHLAESEGDKSVPNE